MPATVERRASRCSPSTCGAPTPDTLDPKLNAHSKLNDITACIQAYTAGADEALMLDPHGFVATCNSTHFFIVKAPTTARGVDVRRPLLPGRDHPRQRAADVPRRRHHRPRDDVQPDRRLQRRRGLRDRHVRRRRTGAHRRRPHHRHRLPAARWSSGCSGCTSTWSTPTWRAARRHDRRRGRGRRPGRDVERARATSRTALMRSWENRPDTVVVDEPLYAALPRPHRHRPPRPGQRDRHASRPTRPRWCATCTHRCPAGVHVQYDKHMTHHLAAGRRPGLDRVTSSTCC